MGGLQTNGKVRPMKYALLVYENEQAYGGSDMTLPARQKMVAEHKAFQKDMGAAAVGGAGLKDTSATTTIRTANGKQTIHDGAFAESKEQLGGFYLVDVPDLDAAIALAKKLPVLKDGAVEIRPLITM